MSVRPPMGLTESGLAAALTVAPDAMLFVRPDGTIECANALAERLFGYAPGTLAGMAVEQLAPKRFRRDYARQRTDLVDARRNGVPDGASVEMVGLRANGDEFAAEVSLSAHWTPNGSVMLVAAVRDVSERKRAEQRLRDGEEILRATFDQAGVGVAHVGLDGRYLRCNRKLCEMTGYSEAQLRRMRFIDVVHPPDLPLALDAFERSLAGAAATFTVEKRYRRQDGTLIWVRTNSSSVRDLETGRVRFNVVIVEDITERKRAEQAQQETERRLELAVAIAKLGFWEFDVASREVYFSPQLKALLGYDEDQLPDRLDEWKSRLHPDDSVRVRADLARYLADPQGALEREYRIRHRDGSYRWVAVQAVATRAGAGGAAKLIGTMLDITELKLAEQRVREAAQHDPLTGLPNRALVFEYAGHLLAGARRKHGRGAFLFIDLDRFKPVNDLYGHEIGDRLLREVARRLLDCVRDEDLVGRLGGDEFIVVLPHLGDGGRAATVAQHVIDRISAPFAIDELDLSVSPSIGISLFPEHGVDADALIRAADLAMYRVKQAGRANYQFYRPELEQGGEDSASVEATVKQALKRDELTLFYQPVIDMKSGRLSGVEALLRLENGGRSISPERLIPIAESAGLIGELGEWVVAEACRQHGLWRAQGLPPITIAINISPLQFRQRAFAQRLAGIVRAAGVDPACVQIEVTESTVMESVDEAIETLQDVKSAGIMIALDDFGTGYSSLNHLSHLPLDKLKVDQSLVRTIGHDRASQAITEAIIALGRMLNLQVVGEGIESEEARAYLQAHGCDQAQGFLFSRPLSTQEFAQWYAHNAAVH